MYAPSEIKLIAHIKSSATSHRNPPTGDNLLAQSARAGCKVDEEIVSPEGAT